MSDGWAPVRLDAWVSSGSGIEVPLPPMRLRLHKDSDDNFRMMAGHLARVLYRLGLRDEDALLDVGCGVGRLAIGLLRETPFRGRYVGFDVSAKHVRWARRHLQPLTPTFRFRLVDVHNERYNPDGALTGDSARFPVRAGAFDRACLFSVFTHFEAEDIATYLHELHRVLKPGGRAVATWFLWDEQRRHDVETGDYPMLHQRDEHVLYADPERPLFAIAHHLDRVRVLIADAGLEVERIELGTWAHGPGPEVQDVVVLRKPVPPPPPWHRRVLRRLRSRVRRLSRQGAAAARGPT
jgi:SAM-dependent methyltransferase